MKADGEHNNQIAKVLYDVLSPTEAQRRSVPTIIKYHAGRKMTSKK